MAGLVLRNYGGAQMIPERLLIHSCTYSVQSGTDRDGNATYTDTTLEKVRLSPAVYGTNQGAQGEQKADRLTLYYDPVASNPAGLVLQELAQVTFKEKTYTIRSVTPCYTRNTSDVHHYEAALV